MCRICLGEAIILKLLVLLFDLIDYIFKQFNTDNDGMDQLYRNTIIEIGTRVSDFVHD